MQLYALDEEGRWVAASKASKSVDYQCVECRGQVRMRAGELRQPHFYHLTRPEECRQDGKGLEHLQTQLHIQNRLPDSECQLEVRFPEIGRIADAVWEKEKVIFEIQFSPISTEEVRARNHDYKSLGYQVIWVLHEQQFNKNKVTGAEKFLVDKPHYFTNIVANGDGFIYSQASKIYMGKRLKFGSRQPIDFRLPLGNCVKNTSEDILYNKLRSVYTYLFTFLLENNCK